MASVERRLLPPDAASMSETPVSPQSLDPAIGHARPGPISLSGLLPPELHPSLTVHPLPKLSYLSLDPSLSAGSLHPFLDVIVFPLRVPLSPSLSVSPHSASLLLPIADPWSMLVGLTVGDSALLWESGILAQDLAQQPISLRGLLCSSCPHLGLNFPIFIIRRLDLMSERSLTTLGRDVSIETSDPSDWVGPGALATFLSQRWSPQRSSLPLKSKGTPQLSLWCIFGFALLLQKWSQLPLPKVSSVWSKWALTWSGSHDTLHLAQSKSCTVCVCASLDIGQAPSP